MVLGYDIGMAKKYSYLGIHHDDANNNLDMEPILRFNYNNILESVRFYTSIFYCHTIIYPQRQDQILFMDMENLRCV